MRIGRHILAVGGNPHAAELSGVSVRAHGHLGPRHLRRAGGLAGMMLVARLQIGQPTIGDDWLISSLPRR